MTTRPPYGVPSNACDATRVLVAVSDPEIRAFVSRILEGRYGVEVVADGQAALEAIGRQAPALVLIARMMPPLDGLGLLRAIRSGTSTSGIPVVLLATRDEEDWRTEGLESGTNDYLIVPFGARELLARVNFQLNASRLRGEAASREHELRIHAEKSRAALRAGEARFRTFIRQSRDGIIIIDSQGTILEWNEGEEQITGIPRSEAVNRPIWEIQHKLAPEEHRNADFLRVAREKALHGLKEGVHLRRTLEEEIQRPDGTRRTIQSILFAIRSDGDLFAGGICRDITERTRVNERLRASEERLSLAIEASGQGLWDLDVAADTAYLSPEYLRLTGYTDGEVRSALAFFRNSVHPDDLPKVDRTMEEHFRGKSVRSVVEYRMRKKSGEYSWVRMVGRVTVRDDSGAPVRMTGVIADITESKHLEEELRERQALLLEAERLVHLGHWESDLRSGLSCWSDEVYRTLGYAPGSFSPSREAFLQAVAPEDRERMAETLSATARDGVTRRSEYRVLTVQGAVRHVQGTVELLRDAAGAPARVIGTAQDITDLKMMEQALADANRRKDEFLAVLSHELRNLLAPLRSSLYVLAGTEPGGEQARRMLAIIERQVSHLTRLVDDLLDVTRIARGKIRLQRERLELGDLVRRAVEDHRSTFAVNGIHLEGRVAWSPIWLSADATRIAQIVGNLLGNAAKFTPRGGRVDIVLEEKDGAAVLRVRDTGVGITNEMLDRLFEPFMQADRTLDRARGGLGVGLALVKGLAELHGGSVTATSDGPGRGAEFTVRLPMPAAAEQVAAAQEALPVQPRRVLIIDDNIDAAGALKEALELDGHEVEVASDGPEGLAKSRAFRPDVVLCDIGLPGMDGYEVARAFRADDMLKGLFLVALTGYALPEDLQRAKQAGFERHLAKPTSFETLEKLLAEAPVRERHIDVVP